MEEPSQNDVARILSIFSGMEAKKIEYEEAQMNARRIAKFRKRLIAKNCEIKVIFDEDSEMRTEYFFVDNIMIL